MLIDITVRRSVNAPGRCSCQFKSWALGITGQYNEENFNENAGCRLVAYAKHELPLVPPSYAARLGCSPLVSLTSAGEKAWEPFIANFTAAADCGPIDTVTVYINQARPTFRQRRSARSPLSPLQHRRTRCCPLTRAHASGVDDVLICRERAPHGVGEGVLLRSFDRPAVPRSSSCRGGLNRLQSLISIDE